MATLTPTSPPAKKPTTTTIEHREREFLASLMVLTVNCVVVMYILRSDLLALASSMVTYVAVVLLLSRIFGCWVARQLVIFIWILFLLLGVLQVFRFSARAPSPASSTAVTMMLVAVAGAVALGVGGGCAYMLHRRSCSKQQRQEAIFLQLRQDTGN